MQSHRLEPLALGEFLNGQPRRGLFFEHRTRLLPCPALALRSRRLKFGSRHINHVPRACDAATTPPVDGLPTTRILARASGVLVAGAIALGPFFGWWVAISRGEVSRALGLLVPATLMCVTPLIIWCVRPTLGSW